MHANCVEHIVSCQKMTDRFVAQSQCQSQFGARKRTFGGRRCNPMKCSGIADSPQGGDLNAKEADARLSNRFHSSWPT